MSLLHDSLSMLRSIRDAGHREIICSFSGGKDSLVTLDLCCQVFDRVHPFFLWICPDLYVEQTAIKRAEKRFKVKVTQLPSPAVAAYMEYGTLSHTSIPFRRQYTMQDVYRIVRDRFATPWIALGHRRDESPQRCGMINKGGCVDWKNHKTYPMAWWKAKDVFAYLRAKRIQPPDQLGSDDTTGISLDTVTVLCLRRKYPEDYAKLIAQFPNLEAKITRDAMRWWQSGKFPRSVKANCLEPDLTEFLDRVET